MLQGTLRRPERQGPSAHFHTQQTVYYEEQAMRDELSGREMPPQQNQLANPRAANAGAIASEMATSKHDMAKIQMDRADRAHQETVS